MFLTPFSWSVQYHSYSAAVIPCRQPCPPLGTAPRHAHAKNGLAPFPGAELYSCPSDLPPKSLLSIHIPLTSTQPLFLPSFNLAQITVQLKSPWNTTKPTRLTTQSLCFFFFFFFSSLTRHLPGFSSFHFQMVMTGTYFFPYG